MLAESSKFGNFKGVMLCNRLSEQNKNHKLFENANKKSKGYFVCGIVQSPLGCCATANDTSQMNKESTILQLMKRNDSMSRHKKWLYNLQRQKERNEREIAERKRKKEEERQRFMEREALQRARVVGLRKESSDTTNGNPILIVQDEHLEGSNRSHIEDEEYDRAKVQTSSCKELHAYEECNSKNINLRPMWAMTEDEL